MALYLLKLGAKPSFFYSMIKKIIGILFITFLCFQGIKGQVKYNVSGYVKDSQTGEVLIGATVIVKGINIGTATNSYGFFTITVPKGEHTISFGYLGYKTQEMTLQVNKDNRIDIEISPNAQEIQEVVVSREKGNSNIQRAEMSLVKLDMKSVKQIPALMGEVDVIKAIQLLPGVQSTAEGGSGFSVRGGASDQNLIILDEATVYNASHLMGFFSVFNNDAIKDIKLYKGDMPASFGGRLSSVLDIKMKEGNSKDFNITGGIGSISSRLTVEGPILKDRSSFMVSGRRTYVDVFFPLFNNDDLKQSTLYFYDLNAKLNLTLNPNNRIFISGYFGRDMFGRDINGFGFGNQTLTARWNHIFKHNLFMNTTLISSNYTYFLESNTNDANAIRWESNMDEVSAKIDFNYAIGPKYQLRFGLSSAYLTFMPGLIKGTNSQSFIQRWEIPKQHTLEHGIYLSNEFDLGRISFKAGLRISAFQNIGKGQSLVLSPDYKVTDRISHPKGEIYNTYISPEPRVGLVYRLSDSSSIKASYSHTTQYVQLASNSQGGNPLDVWFPASPNIKPQQADQWALGYFRNFLNNQIEASAEVYYKNVKNFVDFKDFADVLLNDELEADIRQGKAYSYGLELFTRIDLGKWEGWVSYTYGRTFRKTQGVNMGRIYSATYDKPHNATVVLSYRLNRQIILSANWIYSTGQTYTQPTGRYEIDNITIPIYSERNAKRYPDYHRLDFAVNIKTKKSLNRRWKSEWNISVYNLYNRHNAWTINFVQDEKNPNITYAEKTYLFPIIPSVTYNFKF
ncbi:TonB-dependent receptor [Tenuifilum sp.]|mgnify:FL=1|uniref:TonB-dependent receptor n=1 Tax=Tenuifilum sp. TaxID=2760880 RepID=UPI002B5D18D8|nr:TonB-dependent receptor [Tenuifilum sp.]